MRRFSLVNRWLNEIFCEDEELHYDGQPGILMDLGWSWMRVLKHVIMPGSALKGRCDEVELHAKDCPIRKGCECKGGPVYRNQFIQRLQ